MSKELEQFGRIIIKDVRDRTIKDIDKCTSGIYKSERGLKISKQYSELKNEKKEFVDYLITEIIDNTIHNFLEMLEQNDDIEVKFNSKNIVEESDGLAGELYTEDGWIQKYTTERYSDK